MSKKVIFQPGPTSYEKQPMFFGDAVSTARYDIQTYPFFEKLIEKQLSFFWRPEEVDVSADRRDWKHLSAAEKHIFISNLQYQTLLDSIQGRSPNMAFLPLASIPEVETWIETWSFSETIHSRSYTHIMRNILTTSEMDEVFNGITTIPEIIGRAKRFSEAYERLIDANNALMQTKLDIQEEKRKELELEQKRAFILALVTVNALEAIAFYVSFACSFAFAERNIMEGNAKIIRLISRDESLHLAGTQYMINEIASGGQGEEMKELWEELKPEAAQIMIDAAQQEKDWATYLFRDGSMIGLNKPIIDQFVEYFANVRSLAIGLPMPFEFQKKNPIGWFNSWLSSTGVQVAPQEAEISSYQIGQIDADYDEDDLDMEL